MVASVRRDRRMASAAARRSPRDEGEVAGLDGDVGAGAHGEAEVGLGERGGVVDAVADHGDDLALGLQAADDLDLVGGQDLGDRPRRCRPGRRRPCAARSLSPVSSTGRSPSRAEPRDRFGAGGLDGVGDDEHARGSRRPSRRGPRVRPGCLGGVLARRQLGVEGQRPVGEEALAAGDDGVAVDDALHAEAFGLANASTRGQRRCPAGARPSAMARGDRVLGGVLERAGEAQHLALVDVRRRRRRRRGAIRPVVTVPVLSSTTVSIRRVDSSTSGPLMRMPSCAPRPVPTSSAVGVARPSAQGQAMISTATAAVNAVVGRRSPRRRARTRAWRAARAITIGTKTPEIRSASRCTGALPVWASVDEPGDLGEGGVGADAGGAHDEAAAGVDRGAGDGVAGADLDRHGFAGEQRGVDGRRALLDDAVGGDLLAGPHDEPVADGELLDRDPHLARRRAATATSLAPELEQRPQRGAGAALGAGLEVAAGEDEHGDPGGDLEVDLRRSRPAARSVRSKPWRIAGHRRRRRGTARTATSRTRRGCRARSACPSSRRRGAGSSTRPGGTASRPTRRPARRASSDSHCQSSNCSAGIIESSEHRHGEQGRHDQALAQPGQVAAVVGASIRHRRRAGARRPRRRQRGGVAGRLDLGDQVVDGSTASARLTLRLLGGVVDRGGRRRRAC